MTDDERKLLRIHRTHPFAGGSSYGGGKLTSCCPHCGSWNHYAFHGRSKACTNCGLDNTMERVFMATRYAIRRGGETDPERVAKCLAYGIRVYGDA